MIFRAFKIHPKTPNSKGEDEFKDRVEMLKEIVFLLPIIACALAADWLVNRYPALHQWWLAFSQRPVIAGLLGSLAGYFVGCGIVWATRIFGTLGFRQGGDGAGRRPFDGRRRGGNRPACLSSSLFSSLPSSAWPGPACKCSPKKSDKFLMVPSCHWEYLLL